ncbi:hypothetical protein E3N88_07230 [Mikania micrantha]|uniref:Uncharacterized protein n=1 Tax=Mikania micrantha TaxID=192012 RepID=A0A5N6PQZ0_9ASTR|nr:hypothetical protein E3N88_07230 [Mikania micrantha]
MSSILRLRQKKQPRSYRTRQVKQLHCFGPYGIAYVWKDDMTVLHKNPLRTYGGYDQEAKAFTRVVALAMAHKLYAGAGPHQVTLAID